jgi:hypothetical protein
VFLSFWPQFWWEYLNSVYMLSILWKKRLRQVIKTVGGSTPSLYYYFSQPLLLCKYRRYYFSYASTFSRWHLFRDIRPPSSVISATRMSIAAMRQVSCDSRKILILRFRGRLSSSKMKMLMLPWTNLSMCWAKSVLTVFHFLESLTYMTAEILR